MSTSHLWPVHPLSQLHNAVTPVGIAAAKQVPCIQGLGSQIFAAKNSQIKQISSLVIFRTFSSQMITYRTEFRNFFLSILLHSYRRSHRHSSNIHLHLDTHFEAPSYRYEWLYKQIIINHDHVYSNNNHLTYEWSLTSSTSKLCRTCTSIHIRCQQLT